MHAASDRNIVHTAISHTSKGSEKSQNTPNNNNIINRVNTVKHIMVQTDLASLKVHVRLQTAFYSSEYCLYLLETSEPINHPLFIVTKITNSGVVYRSLSSASRS